MSSMNDVFMLTAVLLLSVGLIFVVLKMLGGFTTPNPNNFYLTQNFKMILLSLVISYVVLIPVVKKYGRNGMLAVLVLSIFVYLIIIYSQHSTSYNLLPNTDFPPPTHLGLDGVTLQTQIAGGYVPKNL